MPGASPLQDSKHTCSARTQVNALARAAERPSPRLMITCGFSCVSLQPPIVHAPLMRLGTEGRYAQASIAFRHPSMCACGLTFTSG